MALLSLFLFIAAMLVATNGGSIEEIDAAVTAASNICKEYEPIAPHALTKLVEEGNDDESLSAYVRCVNLGLGIQNANGTYNMEIFNDIVTMIVGHAPGAALAQCGDAVKDLSFPALQGDYLKCLYSKLSKDAFYRTCERMFKISP